MPCRLAQCMSPQGWGKLVNAALLSLMRRVWVYVVLPSSWVNSSAPLACRHDQVTWEVGRVGLVGRDRGRRGYWVALYLYIYTARLLMSQCFSRCLIQSCMLTDCPAISTPCTVGPGPGPDLAVRADRAYRQPTNMLTGTFCYSWLGSG